MFVARQCFPNIQEGTRMDKKTIRIIPFTGEKEKWHMWLGKFMAGAVIKGYYDLRTGAKEIQADDASKTQEK